jgi:hypothetical protein
VLGGSCRTPIARPCGDPRRAAVFGVDRQARRQPMFRDRARRHSAVPC